MFRFLLSVMSCKNTLVIDDDLKVLPVSTNFSKIEPLPPKSSEDAITPSQRELADLKESLQVKNSSINCQNRHYNRSITPYRVTSGRIHLRGLAPGKHSAEETWRRRRAVADTASDLTSRKSTSRFSRE